MILSPLHKIRAASDVRQCILGMKHWYKNHEVVTYGVEKGEPTNCARVIRIFQTNDKGEYVYLSDRGEGIDGANV